MRSMTSISIETSSLVDPRLRMQPGKLPEEREFPYRHTWNNTKALQQLNMGLVKPRNYSHMEGDASPGLFHRNMEVRCLLELDDDETFRSIDHKTMFDVPECPVLRERLARHIRQCHSSPEKADIGTDSHSKHVVPKAKKISVTDREVLTEFFGKSIALSPSISMEDKLLTSHNQQLNSKSAAREKHIRSKHKNKINFEDIYARKKDDNINNTEETRSEHKIKHCETVILHPKGQYKDNLQTIILQWLIEIPVIPTIDQGAKIARDHAVNELNEALCNLSADINHVLYEDQVKRCIHNFLERLPIWFPCTLKEQESYKAKLKNNLFNRIKNLNREEFNINYDKKTYVRNCAHRNTDPFSKIEEIVINYLSNLKFVETDEWGNTIDMQEVKNFVMKHLKAVVKIMSRIKDSKLFLKTELISILRDIPLAWPHNKDKNIEKYAEELADKILAVQHHKCYKQDCNDSNVQSLEATVFFDDQCENNVIKYEMTQDIIQMINNITDAKNNGNNEDELVDVILDSFDSIQTGNESDAKSEIYEYLKGCYDISEQNASLLTNTIIEKIKKATRLVVDKSCSPIFLDKEMLSNNILVFVSDHDLSEQGPSKYPITSTPKKSIHKLNEAERKYIDDLSKLLYAWIDTIPELAHVKEDKNYEEVMISDLAGRLADEMKLEQYSPDKQYYSTRDNMIRCAIRSWIIKFEENAFKSIEDIKPYMDNFIKQFEKIPVPELTRPQHGSRKDMKAAIFRRDFSDEDIDYIPEGLDIIEDGISIWMNEQPTRIYLNENRDARNEMLHDFALKIQGKLKNKRPSEEIKLETRQWLDKILKPNEKKNIDNLTEELKNIIIKFPQNESFNAEVKGKERLLADSIDEHVVNKKMDIELNKTLTNFIDKFIEQNCKEDDTIVKGAYCEILKSEFRRYSPQDKKELRSICEKKFITQDIFPQKLNRELYYIKEISDWLKNIPIENTFNVPGNENRKEFVINLARDICEVEMEKMQAPDAMDYEKYLSQIIYRNYVSKLPILSNCKQYQPEIVQELINRIVKSRNRLNQPHISTNKITNGSSEMKEQNLGEFIDEYIHINGKEIADDPVKLEVWNARILKEINKMAHEFEPTSSFKIKVYDRLAEIPIPGDDSVTKFNRKLMYAHEIGDWIKNMPLQPISDQETSGTLVRMISDLAEKLSEKYSDNIMDDPELMEYVTKWISALPLEPGKSIHDSVLIQQLSKRIDRINKGEDQRLNESNNSQNSKKNISKTNQNNSRQSIPKIKKRNSTSGKSKVGCSGELIVEAIEDWCNKLPIKEKNKDNEKAIKDKIAVKLFQTVGDLNLDPRFNDDILYRNQLNDEIDDILENLQQYDDVAKRKEALKSSLINGIVEARGIVKERTSGDKYRFQLENTIEASIPNPITCNKIYDPGFELYKNKLANMFILENFDHGDDPVKLKYEVKIKDEIDKYFSEAQKRNAVPLSRDEIYNELYSALFKVPIPNERSVIQEVEEVKLRCEIDGWFEGLPIREAANLNELLDWDKILSMLAKRIYEIENNETKAEDIIHKEVIKWLVKFPFLPREEKNIDKHAKTLVDRLKASKNERKCTPKSKMNKASKKGKSSKKNTAKSESKDKIQSAGSNGASSILNTSPMIRASKMSGASPNPCCIAASTPTRKPADIILEIVQNWCQSLPLLPELGENEDTIKDNLMTNILRKLSELNANPEIFDDDFLYDEYLDDELDRLIKTLPMCCELQQSAEFRKFQLISALRSIKPLIRAERARHEYKKEIRTTVKNMLRGPLDRTPEKALFEDLVDEIVDSFVQYNYNKDDYEGKQIYKNQIRDAIVKFYSELDDKSDEDSLIKQNKLICELAKIPIPSENALQDNVEEIKMKEEVSNFLEEVIPNENTEQKKLIKSNLSKRLHDLEKSGHSCATDKTMKEEIARSLKKVNSDVNMDTIEGFVNKLRNNEAIRKSPPVRKPDELHISMNVSQQLKQHGWKSGQLPDSSAQSNYQYEPPTPKHYPTFPSPSGGHISNQYYSNASEKYLTLLPNSPDYKLPPGIEGPQTTQWYQPDGSQRMATGSQEWHTLPPLSPSQRLPAEMVSNSPPTLHTLPSPSPGFRPPQEILPTNLSRQRPVQSTSIRPRTPSMPPPGRTLDDKFVPRIQTRRQSFDIPSNQSMYGQPRTSLQAPLRYDYEFYDNRNMPKSYRELCPEPQRNVSAVQSQNASLNLIVFNDAVDSSPVQNPQASPIPRPISPMQPTGAFPSQSPRNTLTPTVSNQPAAVILPGSSPRNTLLPSQTPIIGSTMSSRPVQSYQGFQNAIAAGSSPVQLQLPGSGRSNIPITAVPQSTRNAASLREEAAPTVSNIPQEPPEDVSPPEGTHRMAGAPHNLINPPRKRRGIRPDEDGIEEFCDCFLQDGRKRRCIPMPEDLIFPRWCYMPFPSFCYF